MILFIILLNKPIDIVFSILNCSFIIIGLFFGMLYLISEYKVFKVLCYNLLVLGGLFLIFILLFNNFFIFNKWLLFSLIIFIGVLYRLAFGTSTCFN